MKTRKYIIVDENNKPMTFQYEQLVYVYTRGFSRLYLAMYTEEQANEVIRKTVEFRTKNNFDVGDYHLMPLKK